MLAFIGASFSFSERCVYAEDDYSFPYELLDVPEGEDLIFYETRRDELKKELRRFVAKASSKYEYEETSKKVDEALAEVNAAIVDLSGYTSATTLDAFAQTCSKLQRVGAVDELSALLLAEQEKTPSDPRRVLQVEFALTGAEIASASDRKDYAAMRACADQLLSNALADPTLNNYQRLEYALRLIKSHRPELAKSLQEKKINKFLSSGNATLRMYAVSFGAKERMANLVGSEMRLEGLYTDGEEFSWDDYRGKVVLVDFWATWR